jgi:very-short-patch-repair endonuclease
VDASRDRKLARLGYRVLRLDADLVTDALPVVLALIREALPR